MNKKEQKEAEEEIDKEQKEAEEEIDDEIDEILEEIIANAILKSSGKKKAGATQKKYKNNIMFCNTAWVISVLIAIIILLLAKEFGSNVNMINLISITSGLISMVLAIVAIAIALKQESDSNNVNNYMIKQLGELDKNITKLDGAISSMNQLNGYKIDNLGNQLTEKLKGVDKVDKAELTSVVKDVLSKESRRAGSRTRTTNTVSSKESIISLEQFKALMRIRRAAERKINNSKCEKHSDKND